MARGKFKTGPFEHRKRKKTTCLRCKEVYRQRYRPNGGLYSGKLCCPLCGYPDGQQ